MKQNDYNDVLRVLVKQRSKTPGTVWSGIWDENLNCIVKTLASIKSEDPKEYVKLKGITFA